MKSVQNINAAVVTMIVCVLASTSAQQPTTAEGTRRIYFAGDGVPIESQLLPGDRIVVVQKIETPPLPVVRQRPPSATSELLRFRARAQVVARAEIKSIDAKLTPDHSWVRTTVAFRAREVFKADPASAAVLETIEYDGGEVRINNVTVRAGNYPILRVGGQYLLFVNRNPDKDYWYATPTIAITAGEKLNFAELSDGVVGSPINGTPLSTVLDALRGRGR